jgi:hypothetical protein
MKVKPAKTTDRKPPAANLVAQYRPLGLRAVVAAALQVKAKPAGAKQVKRPAR